ncbi:hypothetical protein IG631_23386 [Alternaria alternata]|nr:hypothetical protein IG631_23386 [Alternaria alternata]
MKLARFENTAGWYPKTSFAESVWGVCSYDPRLRKICRRPSTVDDLATNNAVRRTLYKLSYEATNISNTYTLSTVPALHRATGVYKKIVAMYRTKVRTIIVHLTSAGAAPLD